MKKQIAGIFCFLAGILSVNLLAPQDAAAGQPPAVTPSYQPDQICSNGQTYLWGAVPYDPNYELTCRSMTANDCAEGEEFHKGRCMDECGPGETRNSVSNCVEADGYVKYPEPVSVSVSVTVEAPAVSVRPPAVTPSYGPDMICDNGRTYPNGGVPYFPNYDVQCRPMNANDCVEGEEFFRGRCREECGPDETRNSVNNCVLAEGYVRYPVNPPPHPPECEDAPCGFYEGRGWVVIGAAKDPKPSSDAECQALGFDFYSIAEEGNCGNCPAPREILADGSCGIRAVCADNEVLDELTNTCICPANMFMDGISGECLNRSAIPEDIDLGNGFQWSPPDPLGANVGSCSSTFPTPNSNFPVGFTFWVEINSLEECREQAEVAGMQERRDVVSLVEQPILTRTPDEVQPATDAEAVQEAAAQLGIAQASYAPVQEISPSAESRLPEYAAPAALLGALAFSSLYPDYELGSSFNYSGENGSLDWEAGMRGDFHHGSFRSYVSAVQSDSGFEIESGTTYHSDSFLASYTTVEAKDYMNYAVQLSAPWKYSGWNISPNLSSEFHYDRDENHSSSESGAGLDLEYRF